jgi:hypothetical protein
MMGFNNKIYTLLRLNVLAFALFVFIFAFGATEIGYSNVGDNALGFVLMMFSSLGILSQFKLGNIYLYQKAHSNEK